MMCTCCPVRLNRGDLCASCTAELERIRRERPVYTTFELNIEQVSLSLDQIIERARQEKLR